MTLLLCFFFVRLRSCPSLQIVPVSQTNRCVRATDIIRSPAKGHFLPSPVHLFSACRCSSDMSPAQLRPSTPSFTNSSPPPCINSSPCPGSICCVLRVESASNRNTGNERERDEHGVIEADDKMRIVEVRRQAVRNHVIGAFMKTPASRLVGGPQPCAVRPVDPLIP